MRNRASGRRGIKAPWMNRNALLAGGFILLSLAIVFLTARLLSPFLKALIWAVVIAILVYPLYQFVLKITGQRRTLSSTLVTVLIALCGLGPAVALLTALVRESRTAYSGLVNFVKSGGHKVMINRLAGLPGELLPEGMGKVVTEQVELWSKDTSAAVLNAVAEFLGRMLNTTISNLPMLVINLVIIFVSVFYFLRDGASWLRKLKEVLPLAPRVRDLVITQFTVTIRAVMHGMLFTAAVQATFLALGFWFFGVPLPVLCGVLAFFLSLVPMVGPAILWLPVSVWYLYTGETGTGVGVFLYGLLIVSPIDTFLRPIIIGEKAKLPVLLLILAILGGLMTYGPLGLFLGPVLVAVGLAVARIYREMTATRQTA